MLHSLSIRASWSWAWRCMPVLPALRRLRQWECQNQISLGCTNTPGQPVSKGKTIITTKERNLSSMVRLIPTKDVSDLNNIPTVLQPTAEFRLLYCKVLILALRCACNLCYRIQLVILVVLLRTEVTRKKPQLCWRRHKPDGLSRPWWLCRIRVSVSDELWLSFIS